MTDYEMASGAMRLEGVDPNVHSLLRFSGANLLIDFLTEDTAPRARLRFQSVREYSFTRPTGVEEWLPEAPGWGVWLQELKDTPMLWRAERDRNFDERYRHWTLFRASHRLDVCSASAEFATLDGAEPVVSTMEREWLRWGAERGSTQSPFPKLAGTLALFGTELVDAVVGGELPELLGAGGYRELLSDGTRRTFAGPHGLPDLTLARRAEDPLRLCVHLGGEPGRPEALAPPGPFEDPNFDCCSGLLTRALGADSVPAGRGENWSVRGTTVRLERSLTMGLVVEFHTEPPAKQ